MSSDNYKLTALDLVKRRKVTSKYLLELFINGMSHEDLVRDAVLQSGLCTVQEAEDPEVRYIATEKLDDVNTDSLLYEFLKYVREPDVYDLLVVEGLIPDDGDWDDILDSREEFDNSDAPNIQGNKLHEGTLKELGAEMIFESIIEKMAKEKNISLTEAQEIISRMSFLEYHRLFENVTPPSGQTIGPTGTTTTPGFANLAKPAPMAPQSPLAKGQAAASGGLPTPPTVGQTVNVPGPNNLPIPIQITRIDANNNTVRYKSPITGQDEDIGVDKLTPATSGNSSPESNNAVAGTGTATQPTQESKDIARMRQLAGIAEDCSGGATGAGSIAIAPVAMGKMKKRQYPEESLKVEYKPKTAAKTIIGDTKPAQASGKLSADLAASGKVSAGRINNGRKRTR